MYKYPSGQLSMSVTIPKFWPNCTFV